jgi:hypothetical protein
LIAFSFVFPHKKKQKDDAMQIFPLVLLIIIYVYDRRSTEFFCFLQFSSLLARKVADLEQPVFEDPPL